jgi:hypothetical protein
MYGHHNYKRRLCVTEADLCTLLLMGALFEGLRLSYIGLKWIEIKIFLYRIYSSSIHSNLEEVWCNRTCLKLDWHIPVENRRTAHLRLSLPSRLRTDELPIEVEHRGAAGHLGPPSMPPWSLLRVTVQRGGLSRQTVSCGVEAPKAWQCLIVIGEGVEASTTRTMERRIRLRMDWSWWCCRKVHRRFPKRMDCGIGTE